MFASLHFIYVIRYYLMSVIMVFFKMSTAYLAQMRFSRPPFPQFTSITNKTKFYSVARHLDIGYKNWLTN